jgi:hypothetical protein
MIFDLLRCLTTSDFGPLAEIECDADPSRLISGAHAPHADLGMQREFVPAGRSSIYRLQAEMPLVKMDRARG